MRRQAGIIKDREPMRLIFLRYERKKQSYMFTARAEMPPKPNMMNWQTGMMKWANVSEEELKNKREIPTSFGETLSW